MCKIIKCQLLETGEINIKNESELTNKLIKLDAENRVLNAGEIFELLDYSVGCKYKVIPETATSGKNPSFEAIVSLLQKIVNEINKIEITPDYNAFDE